MEEPTAQIHLRRDPSGRLVVIFDPTAPPLESPGYLLEIGEYWKNIHLQALESFKIGERHKAIEMLKDGLAEPDCPPICHLLYTLEAACMADHNESLVLV
jgi:hypothetical protein